MEARLLGVRLTHVGTVVSGVCPSVSGGLGPCAMGGPGFQAGPKGLTRGTQGGVRARRQVMGAGAGAGGAAQEPRHHVSQWEKAGPRLPGAFRSQSCPHLDFRFLTPPRERKPVCCTPGLCVKTCHMGNRSEHPHAFLLCVTPTWGRRDLREASFSPPGGEPPKAWLPPWVWGGGGSSGSRAGRAMVVRVPVPALTAATECPPSSAICSQSLSPCSP